MNKNLDVEKFRNGDIIPQAKSLEELKKNMEWMSNHFGAITILKLLIMRNSKRRNFWFT